MSVGNGNALGSVKNIERRHILDDGCSQKVQTYDNTSTVSNRPSFSRYMQQVVIS